MYSQLRQFYNLYFSRDKELAVRIKELMGITPIRMPLYIQAFKHKSNNSLNKHETNERLEFLGDAILSGIIAEYLYKKYPLESEGFLTKMRAKIVKRKTLNSIAKDMNFDLILSQMNDARISGSMLGNAFEAFVGAIFIDRGYSYTKQYIMYQILSNHLDIHELESTEENFKSRLLEYCQKNNKKLEYKLLRHFRQSNRDRFEVAVLIDDKSVATATDFNKKSAEQIASKKALAGLPGLD